MVDDPAGAAGGRNLMHRMAKGAFLALALAGAVLTGCGGGGSSEKDAGSAAPTEGKQGGKLTMLWTDDVDNIDPGITYYQMGYMVSYATQRPLYSWKPDNGETPVPDLAESDPETSRDGRTVTVKIRDGVRFSPPVSREVTSEDVKYAIERGFFNTVNNGYAGAYFGDVVGAKPGVKPGTEIKGIRTPDDRTIVFKLSRGSGGVLPHPPRPQPELGQGDRLQAGLRRRDRDAAGQRRHHGGVAQGHRRRGHADRRLLAGSGDPQAGRHAPEGPARAGPGRQRPLRVDEHDGEAVRRRER